MFCLQYKKIDTTPRMNLAQIENYADLRDKGEKEQKGFYNLIAGNCFFNNSDIREVVVKI